MFNTMDLLTGTLEDKHRKLAVPASRPVGHYVGATLIVITGRKGRAQAGSKEICEIPELQPMGLHFYNLSSLEYDRGGLCSNIFHCVCSANA